jgi:hypothetical protein
MADTSFTDGDLFIGLGSRPNSQASNRSKKAPPPPPPKGKKRKGEQIGNVKKKRAKHQQHAQPLPFKGKPKPKPQPTHWKDKKIQSQRMKRSKNAFRELGMSAVSKASPWADDVNWEQCRDPAEMYVSAPTFLATELPNPPDLSSHPPLHVLTTGSTTRSRRSTTSSLPPRASTRCARP